MKLRLDSEHPTNPCFLGLLPAPGNIFANIWQISAPFSSQFTKTIKQK